MPSDREKKLKKGAEDASVNVDKMAYETCGVR
jgi:hypothetical protein